MKSLKDLIWLYVLLYGTVLCVLYYINSALYIGGCIVLFLINTVLVFIIRKDDSILKKILMIIAQFILGNIFAIAFITIYAYIYFSGWFN
jgi:hypothetical protein